MLYLPDLLGPRYQPPTNTRGDEQADQDRLQDLDAGVGGDHARHGREDGAAGLGEDEDEACEAGKARLDGLRDGRWGGMRRGWRRRR